MGRLEKHLARTPAAALLFAAATALTAYAGYLRIFSAFAIYDDEGHMLQSLRSFRAGEALYSEVYTQYGPLYFQLMDLLFDALGLPVTHDVGRLVTLSVWMATSLVAGLAVWRLTRLAALGLCTQLLVFLSLRVLHWEPMHPVGLVSGFLIGLATVPLLYASRPRIAAALFGAAVAGLTLVKINVGAFALLATCLFYTTALPGLARRPTLVLAVGLAIAVFPLALMARVLGQPWAQLYALHVSTAILAVAVATHSLGPDERSRSTQLAWWIAGAAGVSLLVVGATLGGTSLGDLAEMLLVRPLGYAKAFTTPLLLPPRSLYGALLALGLCVAAVAGSRSSSWHGARVDLLEGLIRVAAGSAMAVTASGVFIAAPLGFVTAPLAWISAVAPRGLDPSSNALPMARRLWPPLAVLQTLHAYPVTGSQVQLSSFLLIPIGALCIADGARQLARAARPLSPTAEPGLPRLARPAAALVLLATTLLGVGIWLRDVRVEYEGNVPLALPGAARLRLPAAQGAALREVTADLRRECSTHVSLPGLSSFYLWAEQEPPTGANVGNWMYLFDEPLQRRIVERLRGIEKLCGVHAPLAVDSWTRRRLLPRGPLLAYFERELTPARNHGPYTFLVRHPSPGSGFVAHERQRHLEASARPRARRWPHQARRHVALF